MNYYDCHWDSSVWLRSLGVMGLLAAIYAFLVWSRHGRTAMLAWGAVLLLPLLVALAFAPRVYEVTDRTLTERMVACLARYNLADLRRAEIATPGEAFGFPTSRMCSELAACLVTAVVSRMHGSGALSPLSPTSKSLWFCVFPLKRWSFHRIFPQISCRE